jgi:hypothetical protein
VNWRVIAEALFKAAFDVLDKLPVEHRESLARRVHTGGYGRFLSAAKEDNQPSKTAPAESVEAPSNTFNAKSPRPRPPK